MRRLANRLHHRQSRMLRARREERLQQVGCHAHTRYTTTLSPTSRRPSPGPPPSDFIPAAEPSWQALLFAQASGGAEAVPAMACRGGGDAPVHTSHCAQPCSNSSSTPSCARTRTTRPRQPLHEPALCLSGSVVHGGGTEWQRGCGGRGGGPRRDSWPPVPAAPAPSGVGYTPPPAPAHQHIHTDSTPHPPPHSLGGFLVQRRRGGARQACAVGGAPRSSAAAGTPRSPAAC